MMKFLKYAIVMLVVLLGIGYYHNNIALTPQRTQVMEENTLNSHRTPNQVNYDEYHHYGSFPNLWQGTKNDINAGADTIFSWL